MLGHGHVTRCRGPQIGLPGVGRQNMILQTGPCFRQNLGGLPEAQFGGFVGYMAHLCDEVLEMPVVVDPFLVESGLFGG